MLLNSHILAYATCFAGKVCGLVQPTPPPPCRSPPLVVPRGGGGGPSLGQPKIFRCGSLCCCVSDCVVGHYHLHPLHSWQDILLTFAEMELDTTTMFPPGTSVMFIRSTGEPVLAQVVGHSERGDAYAEFFRFMLQFLCLQMCVYGGGVVPQGGLGDCHLVTIPQGVVGGRLPWGGERQGGGRVLGGLPKVRINLGLEPGCLIQR